MQNLKQNRVSNRIRHLHTPNVVYTRNTFRGVNKVDLHWISLLGGHGDSRYSSRIICSGFWDVFVLNSTWRIKFDTNEKSGQQDFLGMALTTQNSVADMPEWAYPCEFKFEYGVFRTALFIVVDISRQFVIENIFVSMKKYRLSKYGTISVLQRKFKLIRHRDGWERSSQVRVLKTHYFAVGAVLI